MFPFPSYMGPMAFGIKMGVIVPGADLREEILKSLVQCSADGLLSPRDVVCITESVVARAQNNYVTKEEISRQVKARLGLSSNSKVAVVFPIASRNRFSLILKAIAQAVPQGEVVVQMSYPYDEVGNQVVSPEDIGKFKDREIIYYQDLEGINLTHPITGVEYISLYRRIIEEAGARAGIYLCNDAAQVWQFKPDGVIAADVHTRKQTQERIKEKIPNCITLQDLCSSGPAWSEWGLLGSNLSSGDKVKLAPRGGEDFVRDIQERVYRKLGKKIEVLIYGDGAYKDPSSGIYELADPQPVFAATGGLGRFREGVKYKYLADEYFNRGKSVQEIERLLQEKKAVTVKHSNIEAEGTTPRLLGDVLASLADLISGSADEGTPVVVIKGFIKS